jgi:hypothetical protein
MLSDNNNTNNMTAISFINADGVSENQGNS